MESEIRPDDGGERPLRRSLLRGWRGKCPNCGGGPLYSGFLKVRPACVACGEVFEHHRADDMPTWMTIIVVGHLVAPPMLIVYELWNPPLWVHWTAWPTLALALALFLLPRFKGVVIGLQWAKRMHGFGRRPHDRDAA